MIRWQTEENVIVLQIRLSNPMAAPVRQFSRNLLCPAALPRLHRYDAGLLAALPTSLFRKCALAGLSSCNSAAIRAAAHFWYFQREPQSQLQVKTSMSTDLRIRRPSTAEYHSHSELSVSQLERQLAEEAGAGGVSPVRVDAIGVRCFAPTSRLCLRCVAPATPVGKSA